MSDLLILGPQFRAPILRTVLDAAGIEGPTVAVTAGWQEREGELGVLEEHLGREVHDLRLYDRAEGIFAQDGDFHEAYRARQAGLREMQDWYRIRLGHAKAAARELLAADGDSAALRAARRAAIASLRRLDAQHLAAIRRRHRAFDDHWQPLQRPALARQVEELRRVVDRARIVLVAGGHVAVLLNRLRLFALDRLLRGKTVVAWSAGAMAIADRVVLFHDHPPQGAGNEEVFEAGLGLVHGAVFLPHAATRLALSDTARVALFAQRFHPSACYTLDDGSSLHWHRGRLVATRGSAELTRAGTVTGPSLAT